MWKRQSLTVEDAISFVREKFADMGNDLDLVEKKLFSELGAVYGHEVFQLHGRCEAIKMQVLVMTRSLEELYEARSALISVIEGQLKLSATVRNLEGRLGSYLKANEDTDLFESLAEHYIALWNGTDADFDEKEASDSSRVLTPLALVGGSSLEVTPAKVETTTPDVISQNQFDAIPALVKRRAKLEQVNELCRFLFDQALSRGRCLPVKFKEISQAGIQVFGQTGSSKLATLRYLKRADVNNRDETVTLIDDRLRGTQARVKSRSTKPT